MVQTKHKYGFYNCIIKRKYEFYKLYDLHMRKIKINPLKQSMIDQKMKFKKSGTFKMADLSSEITIK